MKEFMPNSSTQDPELFRREFPATEAKSLGREIELELKKAQADAELARDTVLAVTHLKNSGKTLAKTMAVLEARHGAIIREIEKEKMQLILNRMDPDEKEAWIKAKKAQQPIIITEKDLLSEEELKEMRPISDE